MLNVDRDMARDVGGRILHLRGTRSARTFAKAVGISHGALRAIESGVNLPRADTLVRISDLEGVTIDWIMRGNAAYRRLLKRNKAAGRAALGGGDQVE